MSGLTLTTLYVMIMSNTDTNTVFQFTPELIAQGTDYHTYRQTIQQQLEAGGPIGQVEGAQILEYTALNTKRMDRLEKTTKLQESLQEQLKAVGTGMIWTIITEGWCGDAAQNLPVLEAMAALNPQIKTVLFYRDEHPDMMDAYLTEGGKAIPKLIALRASDLKELGTWGPRPEEAQVIMRDWKAQGGGEYAVIAERIHTWYAKDKLAGIQAEISKLLPVWAAAAKQA